MAGRSQDARLPAQYRADIRRAARGFKGAATLARRLGYDAEAMRKIREIVADSNARNWASGGSASGQRWQGSRAGTTRLDDAVDTGKLREYATTPWLLKPRVTASRIYMNVPKTKVPYIQYLGSTVMGWTPIGVRDLEEMVLRRLEREATWGLG